MCAARFPLQLPRLVRRSLKLPARRRRNGPGPRHQGQSRSGIPARRPVRKAQKDDGGLGELLGIAVCESKSGADWPRDLRLSLLCNWTQSASRSESGAKGTAGRSAFRQLFDDAPKRKFDLVNATENISWYCQPTRVKLSGRLQSTNSSLSGAI